MDLMQFPETVEEFMDSYKIVDTEQIYTNGAELVPIYRMAQWFEHTDAVPVRHGRWIIRDNPGTGWYRITCSECGEDVTSTAPCIGFFPNAKVIWNYCPDCGAKMDVERKEE